jgi:hypothetical protein
MTPRGWGLPKRQSHSILKKVEFDWRLFLFTVGMFLAGLVVTMLASYLLLQLFS